MEQEGCQQRAVLGKRREVPQSWPGLELELGVRGGKEPSLEWGKGYRSIPTIPRKARVQEPPTFRLHVALAPLPGWSALLAN